MIFHAVYLQLKPEVDGAALEEMMRTSRSLLLKIPEILGVKSGRNVDPESTWAFFFSIETESRDKLAIAKESAHYFKFTETVLKPREAVRFEMTFEIDPSKDLRYS